MAKTTDFTDFATNHPNYFPGQYLLEDDFELQHKYLSDRQSYHNQSLHISGIIEGLEVEVIANPNTKSVLIKSGSALDSSGNLIVLKENITFSDFNNLTDGELYIQYKQEKQQQQQKDVADSYTRWVEKPILGFATQTPQNSIKLAKLTIKDIIAPDFNLREYSGISLPNSSSKALTLRSGGDTNPNLAVLTGSLKVDVDLIVSGTISGKIDTRNITSGVLTVERIPNLPADKITSGVLTVERIPDLSAAKITSGVLTVERIPDLSAAKITSGVLTVERIPNLSADKITSGTIAGSLTINTGGAGSWNKLVVTTTSDWGDGNTQYVTIGAGGADGIMLSNPHVTWRDNRASIRYGRVGRIVSGSYWDAGVRQDGSFSFALDGVEDQKLTIAKSGTISVKGAIQPSVGNNENNGIMFPKNPGGGGDDAAWIRYYSRFPNSNVALEKEQTTLEIGISNDPTDYITLNSRANPINFSGQWNGTPDNVTNVAEISNDTDTQKTLMIIGNRSAGLGRRVSVWDRFEVNGVFVNNSSQEHKKDITKLSNEDFNSIISKLKQTPVFRYRFKSPGIDDKMRLGVIAEHSPEEILDESGKAVSFLDYNGFLLAAIKAQQSLIEQLQKDILTLQKA
jgi:hypothetical protein